MPLSKYINLANKLGVDDPDYCLNCDKGDAGDSLDLFIHTTPAIMPIITVQTSYFRKKRVEHFRLLPDFCSNKKQ